MSSRTLSLALAPRERERAVTMREKALHDATFGIYLNNI
jgi:hypothetical protein